jgi:hypothetical protein
MLDVVNIMVSDAVILVMGYLVIRGAESLPGSNSKVFAAAKEISQGVFLVLYLAWVIFDLWDFFRDTYRRL